MKKYSPLTKYNKSKKRRNTNDNITVQEVLDLYEVRQIDTVNMKRTPYNLSEYTRNMSHLTSLKMINHYFFDLLDTPVKSINSSNLRAWAEDYKASRNVKAATMNRSITALRGMLHWAADNEITGAYQLTNFKQLRDPESRNSGGRRCLEQAEVKRLLKALDRREEHKRATRDSYNLYLTRRGMSPVKEYPPIGSGYCDYVYPMIMTSLHTGGRKGSVRALKWHDIDFEHKTVIFRGENSKAGNTIIVPLTKCLSSVLMKWRKQNHIGDTPSSKNTFVFTAPDGIMPLDATAPRCWKAILEDAKIENFRWHDMRHTYASLLILNGVDISTLKELLGHSDIKTTSIYVHVSPQHMQRSVKCLNNIIDPAPDDRTAS